MKLWLPSSISLEQSLKWKGTAGMKGGLNSFLKSFSKSMVAKKGCCLTSGPEAKNIKFMRTQHVQNVYVYNVY